MTNETEATDSMSLATEYVREQLEIIIRNHQVEQVDGAEIQVSRMEQCDCVPISVETDGIEWDRGMYRRAIWKLVGVKVGGRWGSEMTATYRLLVLS